MIDFMHISLTGIRARLMGFLQRFDMKVIKLDRACKIPRAEIRSEPSIRPSIRRGSTFMNMDDRSLCMLPFIQAIVGARGALSTISMCNALEMIGRDRITTRPT